MGFNSVAVVMNDYVDRIRNDGEYGVRLSEAVLGWSGRHRNRMSADATGLRIVSQAHADYAQVVVVGRNSGESLTCDGDSVSEWALSAVVWELKRRGYRVTKPKHPAPLPTISLNDKATP